ncbi:MAG: hypothetical protein ACTSV2_16995 [Candidatus Thorarchaeota archaeon]
MSDGSPRLHFIDRERRKIDLLINEVTYSYPLNVIPDNLYEALAGIAEGADEEKEKMERMWYSPFNKPTVCTFSQGKPFPFNCVKKSIRLVLTDKVIAEMIDELEGKLLSWQGANYDDTIKDRLDTFTNLFLDDNNIDRFVLGCVEIFGDVTYQNILHDPRVAMNFYHPQSKKEDAFSYQINAIAEIFQPGDLFFRYMTVMRTFFARTFISLRSPSYVCAYKFWISEDLDKSFESKPGFIPPTT